MIINHPDAANAKRVITQIQVDLYDRLERHAQRHSRDTPNMMLVRGVNLAYAVLYDTSPASGHGLGRRNRRRPEQTEIELSGVSLVRRLPGVDLRPLTIAMSDEVATVFERLAAEVPTADSEDAMVTALNWCGNLALSPSAVRSQWGLEVDRRGHLQRLTPDVANFSPLANAARRVGGLLG